MRAARHVVAVLAGSIGMLAYADPALAACGSWHVVASPPVRGALADVSASSSTNAWSVGTWGTRRTLAERWNGSTWRRIATPNPGRRFSTLSAVVTIADDDAWAVGSFGTALGAPLLLHWNGTAWHRQLLPPGARNAELNDVAATSANDVWVVGSTRSRRTARILHYDGSAWRIVPAVSSKVHPILESVTATSRPDAWAVGFNLMEHWDGHAWHRVILTDRRAHDFVEVAATSTTDAWLLDDDVGGVTYHWNGLAWARAATWAPGTSLADVAAADMTDAWAVGTKFGRGAAEDQPTVSHWNGAHWAQTLLTRRVAADFSGVGNVPGTTAYWAVGLTVHGIGPPTFFTTPRIERLC